MNTIEILRVFAGFVFINVLPGYIISRKVFPDGSPTLRLASSIILSMMVTSAPPMILTLYLGLKWPISLYISLAAAFTISIYLLLKEKYAKPKISRKHLTPLVLVGLAILKYSYPYITLNQSIPFGFDPSLHCRDIKNIVNNNVVNPSGIYLQTFHFMVAANVAVMDLPIPSTFIITSLIIASIIALEVYVFTEKTLNSHAALLSYITVLLLTVHPFHSLTDGLIPELFGISVLMLGIIKLIDLVRDKSLRSMIYCGVIIGFSLYIHITPLAILLFTPFLILILLLHILKSVKTFKLHGRSLKLRVGMEVADSIKLALKIFTVIPIALLTSLPSSLVYIVNIILSLAGEKSSLPTGEFTRPVFPHDFEMVFGKELLYLGLISLTTLPIISRRREYMVIYSIIISQLLAVCLPLVQVPFRFLRIVPIFLSVVVGLFIYSILERLQRLGYRSLRTFLKVLSILIISLIFISSTPRVIESSVQLAKSNIWYFPEDVSSYMLFKNLTEGTILTDFSCGWLPYFTENKLIIIPPYGLWSSYSSKDQEMFRELLSASSKPVNAYNTLSKYNISYIYLGVNPQKRHFTPPGYMEVRLGIEEIAETLQNNSLISKIYIEEIDNETIKIYVVKH